MFKSYYYIVLLKIVVNGYCKCKLFDKYINLCNVFEIYFFLIIIVIIDLVGFGIGVR